MIQTLFGSVEQEPTLLERLKSGVQKTRAGLVSALEDALQGKKEIDAGLLDELEFTLISADIGVSTSSDPSAVLFDAVQAAKSRKVDYVIVDTAGRLQTKENLMAELHKMTRTAKKVIPDAPHEVLLVLDATTGQNGLEQARKFTETC